MLKMRKLKRGLSSKKALSVIIGFVLLIVFGVIMGVIVYKWQKSFVPEDEYAACSEEVSLTIVNQTYDCNQNTLTFFIQNNGQFAVGGYFIYVKDDPEKTIATVEISNNNTDETSRLHDTLGYNGIKLGEMGEDIYDNSFGPGEVEKETYTMVGISEPIYSIEIIPIRWQTEGNKKDILASCREKKIIEEISGCSQVGLCEDDGSACLGRVCGTVLNNCYAYVTCPPGCGEGDFCNSTGQCVTPEDCSYTCASLGYICGTHTICGVVVTCGTLGGACPDGLECSNGRCVDPGSTCDGVWLPPESPGVQCDDPADPQCDGCVCQTGYDPDGTGGCVEEGSGIPESCTAVCADLGYVGGPQSGSCQQNQAQCNNYCNLNGVLEPSGNIWCDDYPQVNCCCCLPIL